MSRAALTVIWSLIALLPATLFAQAPKLTKFLKEGEMTRGDVVVVEPPEEINEYLKKVQVSASADPEWFKEFTKESPPGVPLPFDEKLGLTKEEYDSYIALWEKREFVSRSPVGIKLEKTEGGWAIRVTGPGWPISLLSYDPETDTFTSTNGKLEKIADVDAPADSILRAWTGYEWRLEETGTLTTLRENFAIGAAADKKHGLLIYRLQEVGSSGRRIDDKSLVIRFALPAK